MTGRVSPIAGFETQGEMLGTEPGFDGFNAEWPIFPRSHQGLWPASWAGPGSAE